MRPEVADVLLKAAARRGGVGATRQGDEESAVTEPSATPAQVDRGPDRQPMNPADSADWAACVWLTGLPSAGKTTIAQGLATVLRARGRRVEVLDGDAVRLAIAPELGFSKIDRDTHVARLGYLGELLTRNGIVAICAAISPYAAARGANRARLPRFVEVFVKCPLPKLIERDAKGLYRRALAGEIPNFTGISDPYEEPERPEVVLETDRESAAASVSRLVRYLDRMGLT
jgi:adenylyl-sulfate kinase